ncbi:unnamed protein product [Lactuca virosa]|uniref:Uncharacterized protein n=1 Tax=Lactuca virosa TaxID=75947 RepID=A0AAU9NE68_9ASTR|nr:unnamed protein product [Lactuca virosa]CAH1436120.1 unnamed protein product [Lactuca virosa]
MEVFRRVITDDESQRAATLPVEERSIPGTTDLTDTPTMLMTSEEDPMEYSEDMDADGTIGSEPSELDHTPTTPSARTLPKLTSHQLSMST